MGLEMPKDLWNKLCLTTLAAVTVVGCTNDASVDTTSPAKSRLSESDLPGLWYAEPEFGGQIGHVGIEIKRDEEGSLSALLLLLDIDAHDLPLGAVSLDGNEVTAGVMPLRYDARGSTLSGVLPAAVVPVHSITASFRKVVDLPPQPSAPTQDPAETEPTWTFSTDSPIWAGVALSGETLFTGNDAGTIFALAADSGVERWRFSTEGAIRARPTIAGGQVMVQSDDGYLYNLSTDDGNLRWRSTVQETSAARLGTGDQGFRYDHFASSVEVADGMVYVGSVDRNAYAFDERSGNELWRFETGDLVLSTPAIDDGRVFVGSFDGYVYALDATSGALLWKHDTGAEVSSSPAIFEDLVVIGSRSYDLVALRASNGELVWSYYYWSSWVESSATVRDGTVYIGSSDAQRLYSLTAKTGELRWELDGGGSLWATPAATDTMVFIGSVGVADYIVDHQAIFWAVDRESGRPLWMFRMPKPDDLSMWGFASSPAADSGHVFVGGLDGNLYAF